MSRIIVFLSATILVMCAFLPLQTEAVRYAPGATTNPACAPTDADCGIATSTASVGSGVTGQVPYYASDGSGLTATSSLTILQNGYVGIGSTTPSANFAVHGTSFFDGMLTALSATISNLIATTITGTNATFTNATSTNLFATNAVFTNATTTGNGYFSGWVGIGTTNPTSKLDVAGTTTAQAFAFSGNSNTWELRGRGTDVATWGVPYFRSTIANSPTAFDVMPNGTGGSEVTGKAWIDVCNSDLSPTNSHDFECLVLAAQSSQFAVGSHPGGTGSDRRLNLGGSSVYIRSTAFGSGTDYAKFTNLGSYFSPSGTDRVWITDTDIRLGVGMDFRWNNGADPYSGSLDTGFARNAAGVVEVNTGTAGAIGDLRVRSLNPTTGNVGIGTTSPYAKLSIHAGAGETNANLFVIASSTASATTTLFKLTNAGALQFGGYGAGSLQTDASGNVTVSSDERLKNIDGTFSRSIAELLKLNPISYHWNGASGLDQNTQYAGFSAQNVQQAIPEAVGSSTSGYLTLQDRPILATMVNAIKDIANIAGVFKDKLVAWLGDAGNGIGFIFAKEGRFTDKLCVGSTCVSEQQLAALLASQTASGSNSGANTTSTPATLTLSGNNPVIWQQGTAWHDNLGALFTYSGQSETIYSTTTVDTDTAGTTTIDYWARVPSTLEWLHTVRTVVIEGHGSEVNTEPQVSPFGNDAEDENLTATTSADVVSPSAADTPDQKNPEPADDNDTGTATSTLDEAA